MIAALNRHDRHHRWALKAIDAHRELQQPIVVPEVVAGEAFTKLRYDHRVSGRADARPALTVFGLLGSDPSLFELRSLPVDSYRRTIELLAKYIDQAFSWIDAVVLLTADDDRRVEKLWTVDASLASYAFSHQVAVAIPSH